MSDPAHGTVEPDSSHDAGSPPAGATEAVASGGGDFRPGQRWRSVVIEKPLEGGAPRTYLGEHLGRMEKVVLRAFPISPATEWRQGAWERLLAVPESRVVPCLEAHEEAGWRYEVSAVPPAMTLREWMACHRPNFAEVEAFMRQMAATLGALHSQGVVHLNIRPESIYIDESKGDPIYLLGGLHQATLYTQPELMPAEVDPFYAPPETAGLAQHAPGTRLCAWDWWSVGRVLQEFLIGQHVFALVFDRDVSRPTPDLRVRAEQLLLERAPAGVRAGALDYTTVDAGCMPLLRGLLTSALEARWGLDAVQRWLRREPVRDYYDLPRSARMWSWKGRLFTLAEAAGFFTDAEHWDVGEDMLFHPHEPDTLAAFLQQVPAHRADWERLQAVCDLTESSAWEGLPVVARRTVTAALAWLALANGAGGRLSFRVRGHVIDLNGLGELLRTGGAETGVALVNALLSAPVIQFVEPLDASAARVLRGMAEKGAAAVAQALQHGWLDPHDTAGHLRMYELALVSGATLRERVDLLRAAYATNAQPELARLFASKMPEPAEIVVLAFTGEQPERHGYITHENWRRQQCADVKARGDRIATALMWVRLRRVLAVFALWGAPSPIFAGIVLVLTGVAGGWSRSALWPTAVAAALLLSRVWLWWRARGMVRRFDPAAAPWKWTDGGRRARAEAQRVLVERNTAAAELAPKLREVRRSAAKLASPTVRSPQIREPHLWDLWLVFAAATAVAVGALLLSAKRPKTVQTPAPPANAATSTVPKTGPAEAGQTAAPDAAALLASGRYEIVDDGFGRRLRGPLQPWPFRPTGPSPTLRVKERATATEDQTAFALVSATLLLQPYPRNAVRLLLAVRVPTTRGFGVLVFNTRDRELFDRDVLLLEQPLADRTWHQLDHRRVFFLGSPLPDATEISLAPRE